jgi:hypothetical protein
MTTDNEGRYDATTEPFEAKFVDKWLRWSKSADYVVMSDGFSSFLPWTPQLVSYFDANFRLMASGFRTNVYGRT